MDYFKKLLGQVRGYTFGGILLSNILVGGALYASFREEGSPGVLAIVGILILAIVVAWGVAHLIALMATEPTQFLWKAILHVAPGHHEVNAPDLQQSRIGKELVSSLVMQVYQLASEQAKSNILTPPANAPVTNKFDSQIVLSNFPLPVIIIDDKQTITFANPVTLQYLNRPQNEVVGNNLYSVMDLAFQGSDTFDAWLQECRASKVTAQKSWEHVRMNLSDGQTKRQFDMAAYYNKGGGSAEAILTLFDKAKAYGNDDDNLSFIALAVHELRTPLTILRGYIEVFEDELKGKVSPEQEGFMLKMKASAQQLATFVNNILNVARVEENQLFLELHEENWEQLLRGICSDMELRARVHNKKLELNIQANLPTVGADKVSIYEVVSNLIDNAIKYSDRSDRIIIRTYLKDDGMVETTVQDFGIGIPSSIIGNLFEKFYRNHRSRASVGGTGLGLYLTKAIMTAHGGNVWVQSKEGEGSTFGFTLQPYAELAENLKSKDNTDMQRVAHGWIKNHSFYRK